MLGPGSSDARGNCDTATAQQPTFLQYLSHNTRIANLHLDNCFRICAQKSVKQWTNCLQQLSPSEKEHFCVDQKREREERDINRS